jgi:hypothetical protein
MVELSMESESAALIEEKIDRPEPNRENARRLHVEPKSTALRIDI